VKSAPVPRSRTARRSRTKEANFLGAGQLFGKPAQLFLAAENTSEIGGYPGKLFQHRRMQKGGGACRRKGRQKHGVLAAVFVCAQPFA
jgi:hypothetical protein